jgi:hypothetical protein
MNEGVRYRSELNPFNVFSPVSITPDPEGDLIEYNEYEIVVKERDEARDLVRELAKAWDDEHWCCGEFIPYEGYGNALETAQEAVRKWDCKEALK